MPGAQKGNWHLACGVWQPVVGPDSVDCVDAMDGVDTRFHCIISSGCSADGAEPTNHPLSPSPAHLLTPATRDEHIIESYDDGGAHQVTHGDDARVLE